MIEMKDVWKVFNEGRPNEFAALRGVTLEIESSKLTVLKGPSGSGKTSVLSVLGCMSRPTSGRVWLTGRELTSLPERFLTDIRRTGFGFVFQHFNLIRGITALENVMIPAYPLGGRRSGIRARAKALFKQLAIEGKEDSDPRWLSGGEAQRVAIARALVNDPDVLVADEPTAHLDTELSGELMGIFAQLRQGGKTVVIASHDPLMYESKLVDRVHEIRDGLLV